VTLLFWCVVLTVVAFCIGVAFAVASMGDRADQRVMASKAAFDEMVTQRDYWRTRAERLMDAALVRAGATHQPTMEDTRPADRVRSAQSMLTAALSVTEIDSSQHRKAVS
jgi:hypothetical protein